MSHGVECNTANQKTRVQNFTKIKRNRMALQAKIFIVGHLGTHPEVLSKLAAYEVIDDEIF